MKSLFRELKSLFRELKSLFRELKSLFRELKSLFRELKSLFRELKSLFLGVKGLFDWLSENPAASAAFGSDDKISSGVRLARADERLNPAILQQQRGQDGSGFAWFGALWTGK